MSIARRITISGAWCSSIGPQPSSRRRGVQRCAIVCLCVQTPCQPQPLQTKLGTWSPRQLEHKQRAKNSRYFTGGVLHSGIYRQDLLTQAMALHSHLI